MRRASSLPSEPTTQFRKQGWTRWIGCATARLSRQRRKELSDDHPRRAVEQATTDARHLAADRRLVDVANRSAAGIGRNQRDAPFAAAKSERAFRGSAERDRMRR